MVNASVIYSKYDLSLIDRIVFVAVVLPNDELIVVFDKVSICAVAVRVHATE